MASEPGHVTLASANINQYTDYVLPGFSKKQSQSLITTFGRPKNTSYQLNSEIDDKGWIIDTGASNHVTGNLSCLKNLRDVTSFPVGLPNGEKVAATKEGIVQLSDKICLNRVL